MITRWIDNIAKTIGPNWWLQIERVIEADELLMGSSPLASVKYPELRIVFKNGSVLNIYAEGDEAAHLEIEFVGLGR